MELEKTYNSPATEAKWLKIWSDKKLFESKPDGREPFTVVIPPPNVTGILHMGHTLNETIQDILIRREHMQGKNTCWVPGTDHASIATEAKVVAMLREQGIEKSSLSREEFLVHAMNWKEKYGGIILNQIYKLGCAVDFSRTHFTMDPGYYNAVINVFIDLYKKGLIYRGVRMINWDPKAKTALSDEEVIYKEVKSNLYYVSYVLADDDEMELNEENRKQKIDRGEVITVATTRPETILGDVAICIHPNDPRYEKLKGKFCFVPLVNRRVPIIEDDYITMEFGTGALKVTPAHDINDYNLGLKHKLPVIDTLNEDGTMSAAAQFYVGEDRFIVRKKIAKQLQEMNQVLKVEEIMNKNGFSERTDVVIEPRLSTQWWMKMKNFSAPALDVVMKDEVKFYPSKFKNLYRVWMEDIKDWCISRQLWWGHRIPAWYAPDGNMAVAKTAEEALQLLNENSSWKISDLKQDDDVLDTWFSSWLWPFEVFDHDAKPFNAELKYYYPTAVLVTAPEIIFFWVARMIMAGMEYMKQIPFHAVYFTGIVRDKQGRKMSKSLGNSPDMLQLIENYGADGVRFGILIASPAGNDLLFDEKLCEQGRNFSNKLWNALRLMKGWELKNDFESETEKQIADFASHWFKNKLSKTVQLINEDFAEFNISTALKNIYNLIWDDYCSWYLEMVKPEFGKPIHTEVLKQCISFFEEVLALLHPFMPFVTEEIYSLLSNRNENDLLFNRQMKTDASHDANILMQAELMQQIITYIREYRNKQNMKPKEPLKLFVLNGNENSFDPLIVKLANLELLANTSTEIKNAFSFLLKQNQYFIQSNIVVDVVSEKMRLQKDLEYQQGFLQSVMKKLGNEKFVANAKGDVIEKEKQKAADAESKIKTLTDQLQKL